MVVFTLLFLFFLGLLLQTKIFRSFFYFLLVWEAMLFSFDCLYFVTIITLFKVTPSEDDFFRYYFCLFELFAFANQMHNYPRLFFYFVSCFMVEVH